MSRSIRPQIPAPMTLAELRSLRRLDAEKIPYRKGEQSDAQRARAEEILRQEEDLIRLEENCKAAGLPHNRDLFIQAVKEWIVAHDDGKVWQEPTHVTLPPVLKELIETWGRREASCYDKGPPGIREGDQLCGMTVVFGPEFKLELRREDPAHAAGAS